MGSSRQLGIYPGGIRASNILYFSKFIENMLPKVIKGKVFKNYQELTQEKYKDLIVMLKLCSQGKD